MLDKHALIRNCQAIFAAVLLSAAALPGESLPAGGLLRERLRARLGSRRGATPGARSRDYTGGAEMCKIAGLDVAVWKPPQQESRVPLVVFSHGYHGRNTQSVFIMTALSSAGYLVVAPNHKDAIGNGGGMGKPEVGFGNVSSWDESTYRDRGDDIARLIDALRKDPRWSNQIDWDRIALCGHSLGGYTVLALGGAWPSWKLPGLKAVLALSPYCQPFVATGNLGFMSTPVMYQGGTRDLGITPAIKRPQGAYSKTSSPAYFVEFEKAGHCAWTVFNRDKVQEDLISHYCLAFLDKYLKGSKDAKPELKLPGVTILEAK